MTDIPQFIHALVEQGNVERALDWASGSDERLIILAEAGCDERLQAEVSSRLDGELMDGPQIYPDGESIVVETINFHGRHSTHVDRHGETTVSETGWYIHNETDIEFEFEYIDDELQTVCTAAFNNSVSPSDAAKQAYRRSRGV